MVVRHFVIQFFIILRTVSECVAFLFKYIMDEAQVKKLLKEQADLQEQKLAALESRHANELATVKANMESSNFWARELMIKQGKAKMKDPANKQAVAYLEDERLDNKDLADDFMKKFADKEGKVNFKITQSNYKAVEDTLQKTFKHLQIRDRKNRFEKEQYNMANMSLGGWGTVKKFKEDKQLFSTGEDDVHWYLQEEDSVEKKMEKYRKAEADHKKQLAFYKTLSKKSGGRGRGKRSFSRWNYSPSSSSEVSMDSGFKSRRPIANNLSGLYRTDGQWRPSFTPPMLHQPPFPVFEALGSTPVWQQPKKTCHKCGQEGHFQKDCKSG